MTEHQPSAGTDAALVALLGAAGLAGVLCAGAACSAWLAGHRVPHAGLLAGFVAFAHLGDPSAAWGAPVGPAILYWSVTALALAIAGLVAYGGWRLWRSAGTPAQSVDPSHVDGLATRGEVRRSAGSKALLTRSATLRPSISRPRPTDVGYRLGRHGGSDAGRRSRTRSWSSARPGRGRG